TPARAAGRSSTSTAGGSGGTRRSPRPRAATRGSPSASPSTWSSGLRRRCLGRGGGRAGHWGGRRRRGAGGGAGGRGGGWGGEGAEAVKRGLVRAQGALVDGVHPDTPAATAGLRPKDVILELDGAPVRNENQFINKISSLPPGQRVRLKVWRERRAVTVEAG